MNSKSKEPVGAAFAAMPVEVPDLANRRAAINRPLVQAAFA
jgi:hypothetical protein